MIKILQVIGNLSVGGAENMVMNYWRTIDKTQFQFDFLVYGDSIGEYEMEAIEMGAKVIHIKEPSKGYATFLNNLIEVFEKYGPYDIVHSHTLLNSGLISHAASKHGIKKLITHSHSTKNRIEENFITIMYKKTMQYLINKHTDTPIACSVDAGSYLFGKDNFHKKGIVLKNGIEVESYLYNQNIRKIKKSELDLGEKLVIGSVGRFHEVKNIPFLVDVFNEIHKKNSNTILLLVGDGEEKEKIIERIDSYNLGNSVKLLGVRSDVSELMQAMDIYVMPSLFEGFPLVTIEAQSASLPCLLSDKITKELRITESVEYLSLGEVPTVWAEKVLDMLKLNLNKRKPNNQVKLAGYDIKSEVIKLEKIYLDN